MACPLLVLVLVAVLHLEVWKVKVSRNHDAAVCSVGPHWSLCLSTMPQSVVDDAVGPFLQKPEETHHVLILLLPHDCPRYVGISPSYVGDTSYIGIQEQPHRLVALVL